MCQPSNNTYDPDSTPCLTLRRLTRSLDKAFLLLPFLDTVYFGFFSWVSFSVRLLALGFVDWG